MTRAMPLLSLFVVCSLSCSTGQQSTSGTAAVPTGRPCIDNLTIEGSFLSGRTSKTYQDFNGVTKSEAFDRTLTTVAGKGYQVTSSNKDAGLISASQGVTGSSKTVPLNVVITNAADGTVRVQLVFVTTGGLAFSKESLETEFCAILASVGS